MNVSEYESLKRTAKAEYKANLDAIERVYEMEHGCGPSTNNKSLPELIRESKSVFQDTFTTQDMIGHLDSQGYKRSSIGQALSNMKSKGEIEAAVNSTGAKVYRWAQPKQAVSA